MYFLKFSPHSALLSIGLFQISQKPPRFRQGLMTCVLPTFSKLFDSNSLVPNKSSNATKTRTYIWSIVTSLLFCRIKKGHVTHLGKSKQAQLTETPRSLHKHFKSNLFFKGIIAFKNSILFF